MSDAPTFIGVVTGGKVHLDTPQPYNAYIAQMEADEVEVEVRRRRHKRSTKANAALHAALTAWARAKSDGLLSPAELKELVEQMKDDLLALRWGYIVRQNQFTGEITKSLVKPHTSALNSQEFTEIFDLAAVEAAKDGHEMVMPEEYLKAKADAAKKAAKRERAA